MARLLSSTTVAALSLALLASITPEASAQLDQLPCLDCSVVLETVDWNGTAAPGAIATGSFRLTNDGQFSDSYTVTVTPDNDTWTAEADNTTFSDVPPGEGPLSSDDNTRDFRVNVLVPEGTAAGATASIQIVVQSDSTDDATGSTSVVATAAQTYAWTLTCTDTLSIQKTESANINLTATNNGNGPDTAAITPVAPPQGITPEDPANVQVAARGSDTQTLAIGVGLTAEDGEYPLRFDLQSAGDPSKFASCTTTLTVTGGAAPEDPDDGGEENDSPGPAPLVLLAMLVLLGATLRRRR